MTCVVGIMCVCGGHNVEVSACVQGFKLLDELMEPTGSIGVLGGCRGGTKRIVWYCPASHFKIKACYTIKAWHWWLVLKK